LENREFSNRSCKVVVYSVQRNPKHRADGYPSRTPNESVIRVGTRLELYDVAKHCLTCYLMLLIVYRDGETSGFAPYNLKGYYYDIYIRYRIHS